MSTGAVLLADIIPSLIIKTLSPFLPFHSTYRVTIACVIAVISFVAVAFASSTSAVIFGVALTSFAAGLGEPTFLAHSTHYHNNCVSTWSSGTGGAGIIGALSYSLLREIGLSSRQTLLVMIMVPMIEIFTFIFILTTPRVTETEQEENGDERSALIESLEFTPPPTMTLSEKLRYIPRLMIFVIPLCLVYFFEYFVNQGLVSAIMMSEVSESSNEVPRFQFELITFPDIALTTDQQYRWYQVTYQIGVFVSRSSVNIIQIRRTWIMAIVQGIIAAFFLNEAILLFVPSISIIFGIIFLEGLQGGLAYVNTYYTMSQEVEVGKKEFAMNIVASSDSIGITFAGFFAIRAHNWICQLPAEANV